MIADKGYVGGVDSNDYATAARTADGSLVLAYLPTRRTVTIDMTRLSGPIKARWFDPSNGAYTAIAGSPLANTGSRDFHAARQQPRRRRRLGIGVGGRHAAVTAAAVFRWTTSPSSFPSSALRIKFGHDR